MASDLATGEERNASVSDQASSEKREEGAFDLAIRNKPQASVSGSAPGDEAKTSALGSAPSEKVEVSAVDPAPGEEDKTSATDTAADDQCKASAFERARRKERKAARSKKIDTEDKLERQKAAFWVEDIGDNLTPHMRKVFEEYSGLQPDEVEPHLHAVRERAFRKTPWPCIAMWSFLSQAVTGHPWYAWILERAKAAPGGSFRIADVGCGIGQELRAFTFDGVPAASLAATDLKEHMWEAGLDLFRDEEKMRETDFLAGDFLALADDRECKLSKLCGTVDVAMAGLFLHAFDWVGQLEACQGLVKLLKEEGKKKDTVIIGWTLGLDKGQELTMPVSGRKSYLHDQSTFKELWKTVGEKFGAEFEVEMWERARNLQKLGATLPGKGSILVFGVKRK